MIIKDVRAKIFNIDFFLNILPLIVDELVMPEMLKKWGSPTSFWSPEEHLNLSKSGFVGEVGHSGFKSQNIAIRALKGIVLCQIWFK